MLLDEIEGHGWAGIRREARFKTKAIDGFFFFLLSGVSPKRQTMSKVSQQSLISSFDLLTLSSVHGNIISYKASSISMHSIN